MNIVPQAKKSRKQYCSSGQDVRLNSDIEDQKTEKKLNYIDLFLLRKQFWKCFLKKLSRQYCLFFHSLYHGIIHFLHINCMSRPICSQSQCVFFASKYFCVKCEPMTAQTESRSLLSLVHRQKFWRQNISAAA